MAVCEHKQSERVLARPAGKQPSLGEPQAGLPSVPHSKAVLEVEYHKVSEQKLPLSLKVKPGKQRGRKHLN